ncbi:beta-galactosidase [Ktedonospora formicarum]|uniref:beta-galactosidase n=1 Tax=Ktedonospora formicarum TaxID=2778364 RepID=A0A8J3I4W9_9CHLR|nr:beta-galactosidase [Ktedonospora formicarum]
MNAEKPTLSWLSDPRVFEVNRQEAHSDHRFYTNVEEALQDREMTLKQSLNGRWNFCFAQNPKQRPRDFYREDYNCAGWGTIEVPGHIQLQGWDKCQYINTMYPWDGHSELRPPEVSEAYNPVGSYVKEFELKPELKNQQVYLSFQGVETAFYVWVNGSFIGYSEDSSTPAEFDITQFLHDNTNRVAVEVYKRSSASWIEDQDFWRFSGIFREVYLYTVPKAHVHDLGITTDLASGYTAATLNVRMRLQLEGAGSVFADLILQDDRGRTIAALMNTACGEDMNLSLPVKEPRLWSAENPYLYRLLIHLYGQDGKTLEAVLQKVGFREFRMIDQIMCLNGKRIVFKGVNRHEFDCRRGRAISKEDMLWDIRFLKRNNINAVRTSHYPNQSEWYRLCDEYGIYLIDETNLESHGSWQKMGKVDPDWVVPGDREDWLDAVLDRAKSMLERDKNHPSVLIWSCGNESFGGLDIFKMSQYFRETDPTRLVHYEGIFRDRRYNGTSDMESRMYAKPREIEDYLQTDPEKPFISCEYMHAMGNSCGGMHLYTELEEKYPKYQGGFIWDYIDQAILTKDDSGREKMAYGGDFDDRATDYAFCTNGIVYPQREPSPKVQEVKFLYQNLKLLPDEKGVLIKNQNLFVSTDEYYLEYSLLRNGEAIFSATMDCPMPAGAEQYFALRLPELRQSGEYALNCSLRHRTANLWTEQGYEQAFGMYVWTVAGMEPEQTQSLPLTVVHGDVNIGVHGKDFSVLFSLQEGGIVSLRKHGEEFITRPLDRFTGAPRPTMTEVTATRSAARSGTPPAHARDIATQKCRRNQAT